MTALARPQTDRHDPLSAVRRRDSERGIFSIELFQAPQPDLGFSESAIAALSCWKYEPGSYEGRAVAVSMTVIVEFEID